ncbi:MAG: succinate dehydrogenase cytochrome b subunit [candidate division KSB1 bacterium]|nr:succinate dehydrogenase cytochrome b subunit [candidate division KSB1 bacterium]MDZ7274973.1 succinate dehydrogenase cytochrome b subunit [candidate division KSB1 bacterium]MDZ7286576.1 succinate dehydrogenase cytochrome b subunit [candidate division KSB1 bacterium]MDZ7299260.1 succinate dehydrogenase cytochrome b subunit [candidate division KSB1 bacterium]MDZ7306080.1 succinate dehydrogenase cytochrome b subunit [candidate division KSB1 bacterium]
MNEKPAVLTSSIGSKIVVALTGIGLVLFVLVHMIGNLQMFIGREAMNNYAVTLRQFGPLLWVVRLGLLGIALVHVFMTLRLKLQNRAARPVRYHFNHTVQATLASRTMVISGLIILAFVVYHLLHFTLGVTHPEHFALHDDQGRHDVYNMVVYGFQNVLISGFYVVAMVLLFSHLSHGTASFLQSLGWNPPRYRARIARLGAVVAWLVCLGFISVPLGVLTGLIKPVGGGM